MGPMWERVTIGQSGDPVFRGQGVCRKVTPDAEVEAATLSWLREHGLPVAEVVEVGPDWLVTREVTGRTAADPWPEDQRAKVVDALTDLTQALHALPVGNAHSTARWRSQRARPGRPGLVGWLTWTISTTSGAVGPPLHSWVRWRPSCPTCWSARSSP
jgi:aminoglycoside phosphotransferase